MPVTFVGGIKTALISFIEEFPDLACVSETKTQCISLILLDNSSFMAQPVTLEHVSLKPKQYISYRDPL